MRESGLPTLLCLLDMVRLEDKIAQLANEVAEALGFEVYDVELLGRGTRTILRVTVEKEGGVGLDDCAGFSRDLGALMEVEDLMAGRYTLEVSSPGLDRPLKRAVDYERSVGKLIRVVPMVPEPGMDVIVGKLEAFDGDRITLLLDDESRMELGMDEIKRARLEVEL